MYNLTIHFGPNNLCWNFLFKDKEKAEAAFEKAQTDDINFEDDFGQKASIRYTEVRGVLLEDMEAGQEARIALSMNQAKTQFRTNKRAQSDPEIQQFLREQQRGPAVINPMGGGFNGGLRQ